MSDEQVHDPLNFMRNMWGNMGFSLPGMVAPTFDVDELDKRIKDMKAVEGWLRMNLSMLQMTIQGLEMQRTTVSAVQTMSKMASDAAKSMTPDAAPAEEPDAAAPLLPERCRSGAWQPVRCGHVAVADDAANARADAAARRCRRSGSQGRQRSTGSQAENQPQQEIACRRPTGLGGELPLSAATREPKPARSASSRVSSPKSARQRSCHRRPCAWPGCRPTTRLAGPRTKRRSGN